MRGEEEGRGTGGNQCYPMGEKFKCIANMRCKSQKYETVSLMHALSLHALFSECII